MFLILALTPCVQAEEAPVGTVLGTVRDGAGTPVAGVAVVVQSGGVALRRTTDERGAFAFPELGAGTWEIRAGGGPWALAVVQVPVTGGLVTLQDVTIAAAAPVPYVDRPKQPVVEAALPPRPDLQLEWARLERGLRVIVAAEDGAPVGAIATVLPCGAAQDPADRPGMARLAAEVWLDTRIGDGVTVREAYHRLGAEPYIVVTADQTVFLVEAPAHALPLLLDIEGVRFQGALDGVTDEDVSRAARFPRDVRPEGLLSGPTDRVFTAVYPEPHPYHRLGRRADLADIGAEPVRAWVASHWTPEGSWLVVEGDIGDGEWVAPGLAWHSGWPQERGSGAQVEALTRAAPALPDPGVSSPIGSSPDAWVAWALPAATATADHPDPSALLSWAGHRMSEAMAEEFQGADCGWLAGLEATTLACRVPAGGRPERVLARVHKASRAARGPSLARDLEAWQEREQVAALQSLGDPVGQRALARARGAARTGVADYAALRGASASIVPKEVRDLLGEALGADRAVIVPAMSEAPPGG